MKIKRFEVSGKVRFMKGFHRRQFATESLSSVKADVPAMLAILQEKINLFNTIT